MIRLSSVCSRSPTFAITKVDTPDPVTAGNNLTYTITVTNNGPDAAASASWTDVAGRARRLSRCPRSGLVVAPHRLWASAEPSPTCTQASFAVGGSVFMTVNVGAAVASGTVLEYGDGNLHR